MSSGIAPTKSIIARDAGGDPIAVIGFGIGWESSPDGTREDPEAAIWISAFADEIRGTALDRYATRAVDFEDLLSRARAFRDRDIAREASGGPPRYQLDSIVARFAHPCMRARLLSALRGESAAPRMIATCDD